MTDINKLFLKSNNIIIIVFLTDCATKKFYTSCQQDLCNSINIIIKYRQY